VPVSVGYENEKPIPSNVTSDLEIIDQTWLWIFLILFALTLILFVWLAKNTSIIRDAGPGLVPKNRTYSLGRTQMAFWLFVVTASYVFIWMITGDRESITESALALLGISSVTALSAAGIGSSKQSTAASKRQDFQIEQATLEAKTERTWSTNSSSFIH